MYSMPSYNYHQLQDRMKNQNDIVLINTLPLTRQDCLIKGTLKAFIEVEHMNKLLKNKGKVEKKKDIKKISMEEQFAAFDKAMEAYMMKQQSIMAKYIFLKQFFVYLFTSPELYKPIIKYNWQKETVQSLNHTISEFYK